MKQFTPLQTKQVNALIRAECCNYFDGNCTVLDVGEAVQCPQIASQSMLCLWFWGAVLPCNKPLCAELFTPDKQRVCAKCGGLFQSSSNRAKYCNQCVNQIKRDQARERMRRKRL